VEAGGTTLCARASDEIVRPGCHRRPRFRHPPLLLLCPTPPPPFRLPIPYDMSATHNAECLWAQRSSETDEEKVRPGSSQERLPPPTGAFLRHPSEMAVGRTSSSRGDD